MIENIEQAKDALYVLIVEAYGEGSWNPVAASKHLKYRSLISSLETHNKEYYNRCSSVEKFLSGWIHSCCVWATTKENHNVWYDFYKDIGCMENEVEEKKEEYGFSRGIQKDTDGDPLEDDRRDILLRAAYDILKKCDDSPHVLDPMVATAIWDGVECDGGCLMEEIRDLLDIEEEE